MCDTRYDIWVLIHAFSHDLLGEEGAGLMLEVGSIDSGHLRAWSRRLWSGWCAS
jgi:hypothetical protein